MPSAQLPDRQSSPIQKAVSISILVCLALLVLLCVVNSFVSHMTPDISVYLLHTRTFIQDLDRFTLSHDSKGIMLTFILALPVLIFGPTMAAAAFIQFIAHAAAFAACYFILRRYSGTIPAAIVSLMGFCAIHSYRIWGGNARPEDFALAFIFVALWAGLQGERKHLALAGAMASCCFFLKISLAVTPTVIVVISIFFNAVSRYDIFKSKPFLRALESIAKDSAWALIGVAVVTVSIIGWILLFDDIQGWYDQTIQWPLEYRTYPIPFIDLAKATYDLLEKTKLVPLLLAGCVGLLFAWKHGHRKTSLILCGAVVAELYRATYEIARWPYLMTILIPLLLISIGFFGSSRKQKMLSVVAWVTPLVFLLPYIADMPAIEMKAFNFKYIQNCPSPERHFAAEFQPLYSHGQTIFMGYDNYEIILLLDAPRPGAVLAGQYNYVSTEKKQKMHRYYANKIPHWVIKRSSASETPLKNIMGGQNYAYHVQCPSLDTAQLKNTQESEERTGASLSRILPRSITYRKIIETGYLQAWCLLDSAAPEDE